MKAEDSQKMLLRLKSKKMFDSHFLGNFRAVFHGRGVEFKDFREYSYGDDARYIDWARSSSQGITTIRKYSEEKQGNILICVDIKKSLEYQDGVKREVYKKCISLLGNAALSAGESLGGYILGNKTQYIPLSKSKVKLEKLYNFGREYSSQENDFNYLLGKDIPRSIVFVLTEDLKPNISSLTIAAKKHDIVYIHVSSNFENTLSLSGIAILGSGRESISINLDDREKKKKYTQQRNLQKSLLVKSLHSIGVQSIFLDETSHITYEFLKLMKRREY